MADDPSNPTDTPPADPAPTADPPAPEPSATDDLGDAGKKAIAAERARVKDLEKQLRDLKPLADKAKELEDAKKSEQERLTEQLNAAKAEAEATKAELLRLRVAAEKGLPAELAARLQGGDEDELAEDADRLLALMGPKTPQSPGSADAGPRGTSKPGQLGPDDFSRMSAEQIVEAYQAGQFADLNAGRFNA